MAELIEQPPEQQAKHPTDQPADQPVESAQSGTFASQTETVLLRLRSALAQALSVVPGGVNKSHDIEKKLGVSFAISWQIFRVMRAEHILEITPHVPKPRIMAKLLNALGSAGASEYSLSQVRTAYADFEERIRTASGDRAGFEAMTRQASSATEARLEAAHRRSLFNSHRFVLGLEQDLFVSTFIAHPVPGQLNCKQIMLSIRQGLRRLRSDVTVRVGHTWSNSNAEQAAPSVLPLDPQAAQVYGIDVLPELSSKTGIQLAQVRGDNGSVITNWVGDGVGKENAVDLAIGSLTPHAVLYFNKNRILTTTSQTVVVTPTRKFIKDVILPKSGIGSVEFELSRWGYIAALPPNVGSLWGADIPQLACSDRMSFIGDIDAGIISELPEYTSALKRYCRLAGWNPDDMHLFRMRLDHPILQVVHRVDCLFPQLESAK